MTAVQTAEAHLADVIADTWPILLDFDGPVTHMFIDGRNKRLADQLRSVLSATGISLPPEITVTVDPLAVLRWAATNTSRDTAESVEAASIAGELQCVDESTPTTGIVQLLTACHRAGRPVLIVSNNAEEAIRRFLASHRLEHLVQAVIGRVSGHPELMKPHPDSIRRALDQLDVPASSCAFIGDSVTDITVAQLTGVRSIGQAKTPRRGRELAEAGADALVTDIADLARLVVQHAEALH